jgi:5-methylthioadenosine/S-adenosylhomocysteine deaminase
MRADLLLLDMSGPHVAPDSGDLAVRVVYSARAADVHTVLVDGKVIVEEGQLLTASASRTVVNARKAAARVHARVD